YELVHDKKPDLTFFRVFGALCYLTNDSENLGKFQAKADIRKISSENLRSLILHSSNSEESSLWAKASTKGVLQISDVDDGFFLGLQVSQSPGGIFINQAKYALEILKKYGMDLSNLDDTPMVDRLKLDEDLLGIPVDQTRFRGMVGSLMYFTASRPDLVFVVCMYARY
ncbi:hypothetical protein Tco_0192282, partial [Tanacetum coccineum]